MFEKTNQLIGVTLLTVLGVLPIAGLETMYAFVSPPLGTAIIALLVSCTAYVYRVYLRDSYHRAATHRRAGIGLAISAALCVTALNAIQHEWVRAQPIEVLEKASVGPWGIASNYLVALALAPMLEEALIRGYMLSKLLSIVSAPTAIVLSAATFAIAHLNATLFLGQFLAGILLAVIMVGTSRLWLAVLTHAFINAGPILEATATEAGIPNALGQLYPITWAAIALVATLEFQRILRRTPWRPSSYRHVSRPVTWDAEPLL